MKTTLLKLDSVVETNINFKYNTIIPRSGNSYYYLDAAPALVKTGSFPTIEIKVYNSNINNSSGITGMTYVSREIVGDDDIRTYSYNLEEGIPENSTITPRFRVNDGATKIMIEDKYIEVTVDAETVSTASASSDYSYYLHFPKFLSIVENCSNYVSIGDVGLPMYRRILTRKFHATKNISREQFLEMVRSVSYIYGYNFEKYIPDSVSIADIINNISLDYPTDKGDGSKGIYLYFTGEFSLSKEQISEMIKYRGARNFYIGIRYEGGVIYLSYIDSNGDITITSE